MTVDAAKEKWERARTAYNGAAAQAADAVPDWPNITKPLGGAQRDALLNAWKLEQAWLEAGRELLAEQIAEQANRQAAQPSP